MKRAESAMIYILICSMLLFGTYSVWETYSTVWLDDYQVRGLELSLDVRAHDVNTAEIRIRVEELDIDTETMARLQAVIDTQSELESAHIVGVSDEQIDVTGFY